MELKDILKQRSAYYAYDANETIDNATIEKLVEKAMLAPTAFNIQNVKFIAVSSKEAKLKLFEGGCPQEKVKNAAVTFIICGDLDGYKELERLLKPNVEAGMSEDMAKGWVDMANNLYSNDQLNRNEIFRSASLVGMVLMLAAEDMGYATGAMSGFDAGALQKTFDLGDKVVPVMLVTVGKPTEQRYPQKVRRPLFEVLRTA